MLFKLRSAESLGFNSRGAWGAWEGGAILVSSPIKQLKTPPSRLSYTCKQDFAGRFHLKFAIKTYVKISDL